MATPSVIRDRVAAIVTALIPAKFTADRFVESREDEDGDFEEYTASSPSAAFRRFQLRDIGDLSSPTMSSVDIESLTIAMRLLVAYPLDHRAGSRNSTARHALITDDASLIVRAIGLNARAAFFGAHDAVWIAGNAERALGETCDFLIVNQTMQYYRSY